MKIFFFIFLLNCGCLINIIAQQSYLNSSLGIGLSQTSQNGIFINHQTKNINAFCSSLQLIYGYKFKKKPFKIETGAGITNYTIRFKYNPTIIDLFGYVNFQKFTSTQIPISIKWLLNSLQKQKKAKKSKHRQIEYYAKLGIIYSLWSDVFLKNILKDPSPVRFENREFTTKHTVISRLPISDNIILLSSGIEMNYECNTKWNIYLEVDYNTGFKPIVAGTISSTESQDGMSPIQTVFSISSTANYQALRLGLQYKF